MSEKTKKLLILNLPYAIIGLIATNVGEAWRIAVGETLGEKILAFLSALGTAFPTRCLAFTPLICSSGSALGLRCGWWSTSKAKTPRSIATMRSTVLPVGVLPRILLLL